jgi:subtilisin-like proprotein convertase family protein
MSNSHRFRTFSGFAIAGVTVLSILGTPHAQQAPREEPVSRDDVPRVVDPLLGNQWHLKARSLEVAGANVLAEWPTTMGSGVVIGVVDDGLQWTHPDLGPNYTSAASHDFNFNDPDPSPSTAGSCTTTANCHGTAAAGVAAARDDNGIGGAGAAPRASVAGLRLIAGGFTDAMAANALNHLPDSIHISSNSWGPSDDGVTLDGPGPLTYAAMESAVTNGRAGKGRIFSWAAGNGRANQDNCNFDGYANSRFVIAVGALADNATQAFYSESCAALLVAAPSNGGSRGITTTDLVGASGYDATDYTSTFGGTSSATPLVSGAVALMLARNPNLTWRDVKHILRQSSFRVNPGDPGWTSGLHPHNEKFGFGQLDATAAADLAATWTNVPAEVVLAPAARNPGLAIPDNNPTGVTDAISISSAESNFVVEHVEVDFTAPHTWRGDLQITLTSPSGAVSALATTRPGDSGDNFSNWRFGSVRHWGESPVGTWTLRVSDLASFDLGTFSSWTLRLYGYRTTPCTYSLNPTSASYDATGGGGAVAVTAGTGCGWTAVSNAGFLTVTNGASGTGNGTVMYTVATNAGAPNVSNAARAGSITIAGQTFQVNQTGCTFAIAPTSTTHGSGAGSGGVNVTTPSVCQWTVSNLPAWATTSAGGSGTGSGAWQYTVAANGTGTLRSQTVSVAGLTFTLNQLGTSLKPLVPGTRTTFSLGSAVDQYWASIEAVAGRSYCAQVTPGVSAVNASTPSLSAFRSDGTTPLGPSGTRRTCFTAPATESVLFRTTQSDGSVRPHVLSIVETTLWANWWFVGGDYSSYTILRNTTGASISAMVTWRDGQGTIVGGQLTALPAGGVIFYDARTMTSGAVAGSVEIAHDGEPGALEGSATTLSATTGLSFDTVLTRRSPP